MKTRLKRTMFILACLAAPLEPGAAMADYPAAQIHFGGIRQSCHHVINLMMRYGSSNSGPTHINAIPYGDGLILGNDIGDLELISVALLTEGSATEGPTFAVTIRNNSQRDLSRFAVSVVAVLGRIHPMSPSTTVKVGKLCAGENLELHLRLPVESLAMGRAGNQLLAFKSLVVAIDSYDELLECNESNNISVLDRETIPVVVPVAVQLEPAEEGPGPVQVPVSPTAPGQLEPTDVAPSDPTVPRAPSKLDDIDIDNLSLQIGQ